MYDNIIKCIIITTTYYILGIALSSRDLTQSSQLLYAKGIALCYYYINFRAWGQRLRNLFNITLYHIGLTPKPRLTKSPPNTDSKVLFLLLSLHATENQMFFFFFFFCGE